MFGHSLLAAAITLAISGRDNISSSGDKGLGGCAAGCPDNGWDDGGGPRLPPRLPPRPNGDGGPTGGCGKLARPGSRFSTAAIAFVSVARLLMWFCRSSRRR